MTETAAPTAQEAEARAEAVPGSRFSAAIYDPFLWWAERGGMADRRRRLAASARGEVLELGAGTGLNAPHYSGSVERLVLSEPQADMADRLERRLGSIERDADVVRAPADSLPFDDDSFDTVLATLVLCTVPEPRAALAEVRRVLRGGGSLLFIEHVRAESERLARWQDRLHGPWRAFADGCNCNRDTAAIIRDSGFEIAELERTEWKRMPPVVRPLISGRAEPAAPADA